MRVACLVILACLLGACREEGAIKVTDLSFNGNKAVSTSDLKNVLATGESGWLPWSTKRYFDREEFDQDLKRIQAFYADRGYPRARVQGVDVQFNDVKKVYPFGVAVFDNAQVRHAYVPGVLTLVFE